jgi:hypothetical protein
MAAGTLGLDQLLHASSRAVTSIAQRPPIAPHGRLCRIQRLDRRSLSGHDHCIRDRPRRSVLLAPACCDAAAKVKMKNF